MKLILFGAPGSGKGTQAIAISKHYGIKRVSLGDILREEVVKDTSLGHKTKNYMDKGVLVPDDIVTEVVEKNLDTEDFVLDGYPRNINQAQRLDNIFCKLSKNLDTFIYLEIDKATALSRLESRRICKGCGANYHLRNLPPKNEGICDLCGKELVLRNDDKPEVIKNRWDVFINESRLLLDFYRNKNKFVAVDARGDKEEVFKHLTELINHGKYSEL